MSDVSEVSKVSNVSDTLFVFFLTISEFTLGTSDMKNRTPWRSRFRISTVVNTVYLLFDVSWVRL